jgi:signal transduction histidine kinase
MPEPTQLRLTPSEEAPAHPPTAPAESVTVKKKGPRGRLRLPLKTTIILLTLLVGAVGLCGLIFISSVRSMLRENKTAQLTQFAYGLAAAMGDRGTSPEGLHEAQLGSLGKTPNLEFAVLTDTEMRQKAAYISSKDQWIAYQGQIQQGEQVISRRVGQVQELMQDGRMSFVVTVPVFQINAKGQQGSVSGYLHVASSSESMLAKLKFLQGSVLLTCMGVVLLAVPIAGLIARHITVPIQRLAGAAHALADGDLSHRVEIQRSDELGELADAFNRMADQVQEQQDDIKRINAGLEQKVHERTGELEQANRQLNAEMAEKEDFLRAVSHDLNAPLRNIAGMTSMLLLKYKDTLEKDAVQRLERIQKNVAVESELINELLELSRIKSRREKIERVDLHELITSVGEGFSSDLETKRITFSVNGRLPVMKGERARLRQVFQNLIDNGVKYMREDGPRTITAGVNWGQNEVIMYVKDTGMGIAADELPHLFHVFRRAKSASIMKIPGKGVGLASVKSIIENYRGRLWAESTPGEGTTFFLAIPKTHFEFEKQEVA